MSKSSRSVIIHSSNYCIHVHKCLCPKRIIQLQAKTHQTTILFWVQIQLTTTTNQGKSTPTETPVDNFPRTPDPVSVTVSLDTSRTVKQSSYSFQFSLKGKTADGSEFDVYLDNKLYNLDAEGNLTNAFGTEVSITPVSAIEGLPFSQGFLTAVQLGPEGLVMATPGKLTLKRPRKT